MLHIFWCSITGDCRAGHICWGSAILDDPVFNDDPGPDEYGNNKTLVLFGDVCAAGKFLVGICFTFTVIVIVAVTATVAVTVIVAITAIVAVTGTATNYCEC